MTTVSRILFAGLNNEISVEDNDSLLATSNTLNFEDSGTVSWTLTSATDGTINISAAAGGGGGGAPTDAPFVTYTASASLTDEFNLGSLTDGILKQTVVAGVATPAIATAGTDYYSPGNPIYIDALISNLFMTTDAITSYVSGDYNTGIGKSALASITNTFNNTATGFEALTNLTSGAYNSAYGANALRAITTSNYCVAFGGGALSGDNLTAVGNGNTACGYRAGRPENPTTVTLTNSTFLGSLARVPDGTAGAIDNSTAVGVGSGITGSNQVNLGNDCRIGIGTFTPQYGIHQVKGTNQDAYYYLDENTTNPTHSGSGTILSSAAGQFRATNSAGTGSIPVAQSNLTAGFATISNSTFVDVATTAFVPGTSVVFAIQMSNNLAGIVDPPYIMSVIPGSFRILVNGFLAAPGETFGWFIVNPV